MALKYGFLSNSSRLVNFVKLSTFLKKKVIENEGVIKYVHKTDAEKKANADIADKGRRWGWQNADIR